MKEPKPKKNKITVRKVRTKKILSEIVANRGKKPVGQIMQENGLSKAYSKNPNQFLSTKTAQELLEEYLPQDIIAQKHAELAGASELSKYTFPIKFKPDDIIATIESVPGCRVVFIKKETYGQVALYSTPDNKARKDAIDMAYKIHGSYKPEKIEVSDPLRKLSDEELMNEKKKLIAAMKKG